MVGRLEGEERSILQVFIGSHEKVPGIAVLTPIGQIYEQIHNSTRVLHTTEGWWRSARCLLNEAEFLLAKIPQGPSVIDFVIASQPFVRTIIFWGYCGCLVNSLKIGECVFSVGVWNGEEFVSCSDPDLSVGVKGVSAHSLSLLLEDAQFIADMRSKKVIAIDMETFYLYKYAEITGIVAYSLLIVSDFPGSLPFYELSSNDLRQLQDGVCATIAQLEQVVAYVHKKQSQSD